MTAAETKSGEKKKGGGKEGNNDRDGDEAFMLQVRPLYSVLAYEPIQTSNVLWIDVFSELSLVPVFQRPRVHEDAERFLLILEIYPIGSVAV
jgi:hypothetical protein